MAEGKKECIRKPIVLRGIRREIALVFGAFVRKSIDLKEIGEEIASFKRNW